MNNSKSLISYLFIVLTILPFYSEASCLQKYSEIISNKKKRTSILGVSIPLSGAGGLYVGYLSVSSATNGAILSSISSTTSTSLIAAGALLSSTSVVGEIITLKEFKTCKKIIQQSKVALGKDLIKFTEEIKKRNGLIILPVEHVSQIINKLDKEQKFCPASTPLPMNKTKMLNLVEDRLFTQFGLPDREE